MTLSWKSMNNCVINRFETASQIAHSNEVDIFEITADLTGAAI